MGQTKATVLIFARERLSALGSSALENFRKSLTPEEDKLFFKLLPSSKLPIEQSTRFFELLVPWLYPGKPLREGLWQIGYDGAGDNMKGIYHVLLKIFTVEMIIKQTAVIWKTYHDQGRPSVKRLADKEIAFVVEEYPELPLHFRELLNGYIAGLVDLTGAKNTRVTRDDSNPQAWKWLIHLG
ncbi:MAG: hypothetical protein AB1439_00515 [candidate division FCPU426 bacterium]